MIVDSELENGSRRHEHRESFVPFGQICVLLGFSFSRRIGVNGQLNIGIRLQERVIAQRSVFNWKNQR